MWPGPGPTVPTFPTPLVVPGLPPSHAGAPRTFPAAVANLPGPLPVLMTPGSSAKNTISYPPALGPIFSSMPRPISLGPAGPAAGPTVPSTTVSTLAPVPPSSQVTVTPSQVLPASLPMLPNFQAWMKNMQDALLSFMKDQMMDLLGAVPTRIMGPDVLRPLSSSGDRASPWAPHKSRSKRANGCPRSRSPSGDRSLSSRNGRSHRRPYSLSSSSDHLSPPSKPLRTVSHSP